MDKKLSNFLLVIVAVTLLGTIIFVHEKKQLHHTITSEPIPYAQNLNEWQPVTAHGSYQPHTDIINTQPQIQVLTPFHIDDGPTVLINRGHAPSRDYETAPRTAITIIGYVRHTQPGMSALLEKHPPETDRIDTQGLALALNQTFELDYLQLAEGQPGALDPAAIPG